MYDEISKIWPWLQLTDFRHIFILNTNHIANIAISWSPKWKLWNFLIKRTKRRFFYDIGFIDFTEGSYPILRLGIFK